MKALSNLDQAVQSLPPLAQAEVYDFVAFLQQKYANWHEPSVREEAAYWQAMSESAVSKIWDNEEDDVYHELLER